MRDTTISRGTRLLHLTSRHTDTVALFSGVSLLRSVVGHPTVLGVVQFCFARTSKASSLSHLVGMEWALVDLPSVGSS